MKIIEVCGIASNGKTTRHLYTYPGVLASNDFEAIELAVGWAKRERSYEYDEEFKMIPGTEYSDFETITSIIIKDE